MIDTAVREHEDIRSNSSKLAPMGLAGDHSDPFDRMRVAQARLEGTHLVAVDPAIEALGAVIDWKDSVRR